MERSTIRILSLVTSLLITFFFGGISWRSRQRDAQRRMDATRISDLTNISRKVDGFVSRNARLPASLDEVSVDARDPQTGQPYGYRLKDQRSYELCADFDSSTAVSPQFAAGHFWSHPAGMQCVTVSAAKQPGANR
jgi:hypothetical protein